MASPTNPVRLRLSDSEKSFAYIIGGGIALVIIGALLSASRNSTAGLELLFFFGIAAIVIGTPAWMVVTQPWKNFDDWSKPLYVGHEHDDVHEEHPTESTEDVHAHEGHN